MVSTRETTEHRFRRRGELGKFFFDISRLFVLAFVTEVFIPFFMGGVGIPLYVSVVVAFVLLAVSVFFGLVGNHVLKT
jgi:thiosulfate reductase cytochrome b subunit